MEKAIPVDEEDQIKAQFSLKRSLEISAGWTQDGDSCKKLRTDEVIDVRVGLNSTSDYSDIAADDDLAVNVKVENDNDEVMEEELFPHCICHQQILSRCQLCPFYFLEAVEPEQFLLEGETITTLAKIQGNEGTFKRQLQFLRHLPYPFRFLTESKFQLLRDVGRKCLVPKISPVFSSDYVFITFQNTSSNQVVIKAGDILGICQQSLVSSTVVSHPFMHEPVSRQECQKIPVFIKKSDFSSDDNSTYCGFARLGDGKMNYKNSLLAINLRSDFQRKFKLLRSRLTVQVKNSVWLEIECGRGVFERTHLKDGCIGFAYSIMDEIGVSNILKEVRGANLLREARSSTEEPVVDKAIDENAYEEMLSKINVDMRNNHVSPKKSLKKDESLLDRTYKGVTGPDVLDIPPKGEIETFLYLQDDDLSLDLKSLLKFHARVTNNEEFQYYNNCYSIEEQYLTIVNGICRRTKTTRPCVKVKISNPRSDLTIIKKNSPLALIKVRVDSGVFLEIYYFIYFEWVDFLAIFVVTTSKLTGS